MSVGKDSTYPFQGDSSVRSSYMKAKASMHSGRRDSKNSCSNSPAIAVVLDESSADLGIFATMYACVSFK